MQYDKCLSLAKDYDNRKKVEDGRAGDVLERANLHSCERGYIRLYTHLYIVDAEREERHEAEVGHHLAERRRHL